MSTPSNNVTLTFEEQARRALVGAHIRLGKFIEHGNGVLIAAELALMMRRTIAAYGSNVNVLEAVGHAIVRQERAANGWCVACEGSPRKGVARDDGVMPAWPMCAECIAIIAVIGSGSDNAAGSTTDTDTDIAEAGEMEPREGGA